MNTEWLARKSTAIRFEEAAATPMAGLTAWQPLVHGMNIKKGDKILIHGASGGVGHFAVQIAEYLGAEVIATSSGKNRDFVLSLGADKHIDYQQKNFWEVMKEVDFVFDTVGGDMLERSIAVTKSGGPFFQLCLLRTKVCRLKQKEKAVNLSLWGMRPNGEDLKAIADLLSKGIIKAHIAKTYPFSEMAEAHKQVETRGTAGKIVVTV